MKQILTKFYDAFKKLDAETMVSCYHEEVVFQDPAFGKLEGERAKNMWRMLCKNAIDLKIEFKNIKIDKNIGEAYWEAIYTYRKTGRKIHNKVDANFEFKDGKIIRHTDKFNLHNWAKQGLGIKGFLFGGTSFFKEKLQNQTAILLDRYERKLG